MSNAVLRNKSGVREVRGVIEFYYEDANALSD